jgi:nitrogen fixation protein FixH
LRRKERIGKRQGAVNDGARSKVNGTAKLTGDEGDVRKEDSGIEGIGLNRKKGGLDDELALGEEGKQRMLFSELLVGGKVAARLAHDPGGWRAEVAAAEGVKKGA